MRWLVALLVVICAPAAQSAAPDMQKIVHTHILPGYQTLAETGAALDAAADKGCTPQDEALVTAYHDAFDAWVRVSHLRFGPSEEDDRAFALSFWPDPRGSTAKTLATMIREADPVVADPETFATVSVAARGFYALDILLFDANYSPNENAEYHCALVRAIAGDIARNTGAIFADWQTTYAALMSNPGNDRYRSEEEALRQVFTALVTGLEFTSTTRLGRPLGSYERPRPKRAEAWRSGRSLRHVILSLISTRELAAQITGGNAQIDEGFARTIARAEALPDPTFANITDPQARLRVESLQGAVDRIRQNLTDEIGPSLGLAAGFNALDGD